MKGSKLSSLILKHIENKYDGYAINIITSNKNGNPDIVACIDGKFYSFEVKGDQDTTNNLQDEKLALVSKAGGFGGYVYSLDDVDAIILKEKQFKQPPKNHRVKL